MVIYWTLIESLTNGKTQKLCWPATTSNYLASIFYFSLSKTCWTFSCLWLSRISSISFKLRFLSHCGWLRSSTAVEIADFPIFIYLRRSTRAFFYAISSKLLKSYWLLARFWSTALIYVCMTLPPRTVDTGSALNSGWFMGLLVCCTFVRSIAYDYTTFLNSRCWDG